MALLLRQMGHEVRTGLDGLEGLQAVSEFQPQVVFLDIGMPGFDGYQAARRIRELPQGRAITLVALTGFGQAEDRRRSRAAGFDLHLVKPVAREDLDQLFGTEPADARLPDVLEPVPAAIGELRQVAHDLRTPLNALCGTSALLLETSLEPEQREYAAIIRRSAEAIRQLADELGGAGDGGAGSPGRAERFAAATIRPLRILVVDDDPVNRKAILHVVDVLGHQGESAADGRAALAAVEQGRFDVVLLDVQMDDIGGPEVARRIRRSRGAGGCPRILGLTGTARAEDRDACRAAGMDAVLLKPVDPDTLRSALSAEPPATGRAQAAETDEILDPRIVSSLLSQPPSPERTGLVEFVELYAADAPEQIARIRDAAGRGDAAELALTAHRLTGSSSAVGARRLGALASKIESLARAGDVSGTEPLVAELERAWPVTREALASASLRGALPS